MYSSTSTCPRARCNSKDKTIDCTAITDIPLLTLEGENDDMLNPRQCHAAANICVSLPDHLSESYVQDGVGHYGIFNGSRHRAEIAPRVKDFIARHHNR